MGKQVRRVARWGAAAIAAIGLAVLASPAMAAAAVTPVQRVDAGADLEALSVDGETATAPGTVVTASSPIGVVNHGPDAVPGFTVTVQFDFPGETAAGHALDGCDAQTATIYVCTINQQLAAGESFQFATPLAVQLGDGAFGPATDVSYRFDALGGVADPNDGNNTGFFDVFLPVDLQAVSDPVTGPAGSTVDVPVGATNLGPFPLGQLGIEGFDPLIRFDVPTDTSVVGIPSGCLDLTTDGQELGQPAYECQEPRKPTIAVGATFTFTFTVQIDQPAATTAFRFNHAAALALTPASVVHVGTVTVIWNPDANPDNNVTQATITETAAPTTTTTPPVTTTTTTAAGTTTTRASAKASSLPVTGVAVTGYVVVGLALIAGGFIAVLASRRRARDAAELKAR